ncbi:restriction endonuclease subunit S [Pectobacterium brasiliense]|uniref:Restriction endonuclease subunit S n=1 Tax=Pectobacterium brasiliense TaxID=180957 RepID=A0A3S1A008_9GAMM|nr:MULTISPECIES: restriction endonuclease subunit S [Pectobacterium]GKW28193.1 type I restriction-modification system restriction endonuclease DNA specificity subunit HsdS [Pectobacterium carotovorum subsp. carotovorum]MBN3046923.1 restriction endonuclease subunit S [Pectobacterium brasiliense]MBN3074943.1 restriction endonuclease subunit S [Pectobacterium brasiliense]MBN3083931.1 restriction endonuclease subunit S [Pectobacterium brasiliense]MBN3089471.1 restriction endonuclease subunit S [Pe
MNRAVLPSGWKSVKIGSIARVTNGANISSKYKSESNGNTPVYKVLDITEAILNENGNLITASHLIDNGKIAELKSEMLSIGTTVFPKVGESVNLNRRAYVLKEGFADNNVMAISPDHWESSRFIYYFMRSVDLRDMSRSTTVPSLRKEDIENLAIAYPPLNEQKFIANMLDSLLAQIETTVMRVERIRTILRNYRQAILTKAFSGTLTAEWRREHKKLKKISLSEISDYWAANNQKNSKKSPIAKSHPTDLTKNIPNTWLATTIGHVFDVQIGATPKRNIHEYWNGDLPWVNSAEVDFCKISSTNETITELAMSNTSTAIHPPGTVMLALNGQEKARGRVAILDISASHSQNTAALRIPEGYVVSEFLYFFLMQQHEHILRYGVGSIQPTLNKSLVQSLAFKLPPLEEQIQIVCHLEELFDLSDRIEKKLNAALDSISNLNKSLLVKAFCGNLTSHWRAANPDLIAGDNSAETSLNRIKTEREAKQSPKKNREKKAN